MNEALGMWEVWATLGLMLLLAEIAAGTMYLLALGVCAFAVAGGLAGQQAGWMGGWTPLGGWQSVLLLYAALSGGACIGVHRWNARGKAPEDPNAIRGRTKAVAGHEEE